VRRKTSPTWTHVLTAGSNPQAENLRHIIMWIRNQGKVPGKNDMYYQGTMQKRKRLEESAQRCATELNRCGWRSDQIRRIPFDFFVLEPEEREEAIKYIENRRNLP
jgi:hypothetical protein